MFLDARAILRISPYLVRMRESAGQNNSEYGHFLRSEGYGIQFISNMRKDFMVILKKNSIAIKYFFNIKNPVDKVWKNETWKVFKSWPKSLLLNL